MTELRGLQNVAPVHGGVFTVVMMASIGVPGLNGFVGEFLVLVGHLPHPPLVGGGGALGVIVAAIYLLWAYQQVFHGVPEPDGPQDPGSRRGWSGSWWRPLIILIVVLGRVPQARARSHQPVGEPTGGPCRAGHGTLPATGGQPGDSRPGGPTMIDALLAATHGATCSADKIAIPPIRYLAILPRDHHDRGRRRAAGRRVAGPPAAAGARRPPSAA